MTTNTEGKITLTREELYDDVWSIPAIKLAKKYGLSDKGLAKKCNKHSIPRPSIGYWQKLKHGHSPKKTPLPKISDVSLQEVIFYVPEKSNSENLSITITNDDPRIEVAKAFEIPDQIHRYHKLVKAYGDSTNFKRVDSYGILIPHSQTDPILDIRVTKNVFPRACLFVHGLINLFSELGWTVRVEKRKYQKGNIWIVKINEEDLHLSLKERIKRIENLRTVEEIKRDREKGIYHWERFSYLPTEVLTLSIDNIRQGTGARVRWADDKKGILENKLADIVENLIKAEHIHKINRLAREEEQRRREEEHRKWEEQQRLKRIDEKRFEYTLKVAKQWEQSQLLKSFIEDVESKISIERRNDYKKWISWVKEKISQLDPANDLNVIVDEHEKIGNSSGYYW